MVADGTYTGVVDRFEVDASGVRLAVVLLEADGEQVGDLVVPAAELPEPAREPDAVIDVAVVDGELVDASHRPDETERRAEDAQSRFDRLSRRPDEDGAG